MSHITPEDVDRVMQALSPQARLALRTISEMQKRPAEDVLRDEIQQYIAGRIPRVDIEGAMRMLKTGAYGAGFLVGRIRRFARNWSREG